MPNPLAAILTYFPTGWLVGVFLFGLFIWLLLRTRVYFKKKSILDLLMLALTIMSGVALLSYVTMSGVYDSEPWIPEPVYWTSMGICAIAIVVDLFLVVFGLIRWVNFTLAKEEADGQNKS